MPRAEMPPQEKSHFHADVLLKNGEKEQPVLTLPESLFQRNGDAVASNEIYKVYFHGPAYRVLERARVFDGAAIGELAQELPADRPAGEGAWLQAPRLVELCFQTAGIQQIKKNGVMALPMAIGSASVYRQLSDAEGKRVFSIVTAPDGQGVFDATVVDEKGAVYVKLSGYRTVALPGSVTL
jgi:hypothetical protein